MHPKPHSLGQYIDMNKRFGVLLIDSFEIIQ